MKNSKLLVLYLALMLVLLGFLYLMQTKMMAVSAPPESQKKVDSPKKTDSIIHFEVVPVEKESKEQKIEMH